MLNLQLPLNYIKHFFSAKTRHGVHSPFVYRIVDEIVYNTSAKTSYIPIERLRQQLLTDNRTISITDLGAGSHLNNNKKKQVKSLAKNALKSAKLAQLIYRLAEDLRPTNIIELGTCLGLTTSYLAKAAPKAKVISIEGCPETAAVAAENLKKLNITNVQLKVGNFDHLLPEVIKSESELDFVFIDGNHRKDATLNYFEWCLPKLSNKSIVIFDDIYWSKGMQEAWNIVKEHPRVTVTIDLFWIGLVFIKSGQVKEHFKVKL
ncbi:MAG: O-methyltransferase [Sphingobacteriales bacterium]|nr:O-methyltransferase [Sphingobacteriales bacterium]